MGYRVILKNELSDVVVLGNIGVGVSVFGGGDQRRVTGQVTIAGNSIRYATSSGTFVHGIVVDDVSADVDIDGNFIQTTQDFSGILVVRQVEGKVRIANNHVAAHPESPGEGLGIYIYANDTWDAVRASAPEYEVVSNRVVTEGVGIGLAGQRGSVEAARIARNHISTFGGAPGASAVSLMGNVWGTRISSNRIDGSAPFGIEIIPFEGGESAYSNTLSANNMSRFAAEAADVFIDQHAQDTVVVGNSGTVIDHGAGSDITGMSEVDGRHVGSQMRHRSWAGEPTEPTAVDAPASVAGTGTSGSTSYSITTGYTGDLTYEKHGLVPAATSDATVVDDPTDNFDVTNPDANQGITVHDLTVPVGTIYTRVALFNESTDGIDDLDLFVYRVNADSSMSLVGRSLGSTSLEEVNLANPTPAAYKIYVHGWETEGPDASYRLFEWVLASEDAANMTVTGPAAVLGESGTVQVTWSGLTAGARYLGKVEYRQDGTPRGTTIVRIDA